MRRRNLLLAIFLMPLLWTAAFRMPLANVAQAQSPLSVEADREVRAVWLTTIGGLDWPKTKATSPAAVERQKQELIRMLDKLQAAGINTILLQTRIRGTVIYPSASEPWDGCLTGIPGRHPGYDPLRFAIDECHRRHMQLHAWVVTLPLGKWNAIGCQRMRQRHPKLVRKIGDSGFLNPEMPETAGVVADLCAEIVRNYDVDGIHLDYARYPDGWKIQVARSVGRQHITRLAQTVSSCVRATRPGVLMSCSPIGKYKDLTRYSSRGWNAYDAVCQDAQGWLKNGIMDQLYPMIYFRGDHFFPFAVDWAENSNGKEIMAGLGIWFLDPKEGKWKLDDVRRQLSVVRQLGLGQCYFRAQYIVNNQQGLFDFLRVFNFPECWPKDSRWPVIHPNQNNPLRPTPDRVDAIPTTPRLPQATQAPPPYPLLPNDGNTVELPPRQAGQEASLLLVQTLEGTVVASLRWTGTKAFIRHLPNGCYELRSQNRNGKRHRVGFLKIRRKD